MRCTPTAGLAGMLVAAGLAAAPLALAGGGGDHGPGDDHRGHRDGRADEVRVSARCSAGSRITLKLDDEDRGTEAEVEVDENRNGSVWRVRILVEGRSVAARRGVTRAPSGSFEVRAVVVAAPGARVAAVARRPATGEVCRVGATTP